MDFAQAQGQAKALRPKTDGPSGGPYTVNEAADDYLEYLRGEGRGDAAIGDAKYRIDAFIRPSLGKFEVVTLSVDQLRRWRSGLAKGAARLRTKAGEKQKHRETTDERARQSSANRILTTLKAMLNYAFDEEKVASNKAWGRRLKPFENADAARVRYLEITEAKRLSNACDDDFGRLVYGALQSGGRYGQLAALRVSDFNSDVGTIDFRSRKGRGKEKVYSCVLTDEGARFFKQVCAGRARNDLIFTQDGEPWGKGHQVRLMEEACKQATIKTQDWISYFTAHMGFPRRHERHTADGRGQKHGPHRHPHGREALWSPCAELRR